MNLNNKHNNNNFIQFSIITFTQKDDANEEYNRHRKHGIRPPYFSRDYHMNQKSSKSYFTICSDFYNRLDPEYISNNILNIENEMWDRMINYIVADKRNPHYYEMTDEGGCHIFGDIDGPPVKVMVKHCEDIGGIESWMRTFNQYIIKKIESIIGDDIKQTDIDNCIQAFVTDSSSDNENGKFSRHVLYRLPCGQWFNNPQLVGSIIHEIKCQWFNDTKSKDINFIKGITIPDMKEDGTIEYKFPFDMQVYAIGKSRCFRAVRSSKGHPDSIKRFKLPMIDGIKIGFNDIDKNMMLDYMVTYNRSNQPSFIPIKESLLVNYIAFGTKKRPVDDETDSIKKSFGNTKITKLSDSQLIHGSFGTLRSTTSDLKKLIPSDQHGLTDPPKDIIDDILILLNDKGVHSYDPVQGILCVGDSRKDCEIACQKVTNTSGLTKSPICKGIDEPRHVYVHKSNHIYWMIKLGKNGYIVQKCHDINCVYGSGKKIYLSSISNPLVDKAIKFEVPIFHVSTDNWF